jgi:hypothetical protein
MQFSPEDKCANMDRISGEAFKGDSRWKILIAGELKWLSVIASCGVFGSEDSIRRLFGLDYWYFGEKVQYHNETPGDSINHDNSSYQSLTRRNR